MLLTAGKVIESPDVYRCLEVGAAYLRRAKSAASQTGARPMAAIPKSRICSGTTGLPLCHQRIRQREAIDPCRTRATADAANSEHDVRRRRLPVVLSRLVVALVADLEAPPRSGWLGRR